jgi:hypothetical protein
LSAQLLLFALFSATASRTIAQTEQEYAEPRIMKETKCGNFLTPLEGAELDHDVAKARQVIEANHAMVTDSDCGSVALMFSVARDEFEITKALVAAGVDPSVDNRARALPLTALRCRDDIAAFLISHGAKVRADAPLIESVERCPDGRLTALLLKAGANVNMLDAPLGSTALYWAAYYGNENAVYILVAAGANLYAKGKSGQTALMVAHDIKGEYRKPAHDRIYQFLQQMEDLDKAQRARRSRNKNP